MDYADIREPAHGADCRSPVDAADLPPFLRGGGDCGALIAAHDWAATPLGPIAGWPQALRTTLAVLLRSPVPMLLMWGKAGVMLYNDGYAGFVGQRHPDLLGAEVRRGWPDFAAFNDEVLATCFAGKSLCYRDRAVTLDRHGRPETVWLDLDYSPVPDDAMAVGGVLCVVSGMTERVAAERRTDFLLNLSDELRALDDPAEIVEVASRRVGDLLGASRVFYAEITSEGWMTVERDYARGVGSIVGTHSLVSFGSDLLAAYRGGAPVVVRHVAADERLSEGARAGLTARQVGAFVDVVLFEEEKWVGLLAVQSASPRVWTPAEEGLVQEVGERLKVAVERARAEARLREMKATLEQQVIERTAELRRYHDIVEATDAPICAFDTDYRLIAFNRAHNTEFRRVQGFETRIGDVLPDLFVPEQAERLRALMARALAGESFTVTDRFGHPGIATPVWEIRYTPLRDGDGRVIGAFHLAEDISARLQAEAELDAAQAALRQSQKMEAMGSLTGGVAHDFNNLLTPIIGSLDMLLRKGIGGARERRLIDGALQSAERARTLVQRLLAFARRQPLQPTAVDLARLVENMAELIGSTTGPTIRVEVAVAPDLPPARADANQLEMALLNLAVNARDAMPDGGVLRVAAATTEVGSEGPDGIAPGTYACLSVTDTGTGMDAVTRERAIEPFFSTKGVGKGTGLGLSMVHGLAAQLGGGLTIDSAPGRGTCIILWLPVSVEDAAPVDVVLVEAPATPVPRGTALLVEDEELVRISTADMLTDLGYAVAEAASGEEALALVRGGFRPDLLVTDHLMPGMSGAQLVQAIAAELPGLPMLIVSGYAEVEGIDANTPRLTKPFRNDELATSIAALAPRGHEG
ncbi:PAS domain-containing protein [Sphingomonas silueang]|uniref:PAS domain-containing protein n=1 Tax=Sphingomonas silueang TaxID=3156617 RepID=UPI0032B5928F